MLRAHLIAKPLQQSGLNPLSSQSNLVSEWNCSHFDDAHFNLIRNI